MVEAMAVLDGAEMKVEPCEPTPGKGGTGLCRRRGHAGPGGMYAALGLKGSDYPVSDAYRLNQAGTSTSLGIRTGNLTAGVDLTAGSLGQGDRRGGSERRWGLEIEGRGQLGVQRGGRRWRMRRGRRLVEAAPVCRPLRIVEPGPFGRR